MVPTSAKGNSAKARARIAVAVGFDVIERLSGLIEGRARGANFCSPAGSIVRSGRWNGRASSAPHGLTAVTLCNVDGIRPWRSRACLMSRALCAPPFVHQSRQLREGLPVRVVAGSCMIRRRR